MILDSSNDHLTLNSFTGVSLSEPYIDMQNASVCLSACLYVCFTVNIFSLQITKSLHHW